MSFVGLLIATMAVFAVSSSSKKTPPKLPQASTVVYRADMVCTTPTPDEALEIATMNALTWRTPLPEGVSIVSDNGRITVIWNGITNIQTGEGMLTTLLRDDSNDLDEARLYKDGVLQATATRANGGIIDRGGSGKSQATLTFSAVVVPSQFEDVELRLEWGPTGHADASFHVWSVDF